MNSNMPTKSEGYVIVKASLTDVPTMMAIFAGARAFMAEQHNPNQWGPASWPPQSLIEQDIAEGKSYLVKKGDEIIGTFFCDAGEKVEPTYGYIEGEGWKYDGPYAVIHRIASSFTHKGVGEVAINFALKKAPHVRIDTHEDNAPMRGLLQKHGFQYRGIIYVAHSKNPRLAFEL